MSSFFFLHLQNTCLKMTMLKTKIIFSYLQLLRKLGLQAQRWSILCWRGCICRKSWHFDVLQRQMLSPAPPILYNWACHWAQNISGVWFLQMKSSSLNGSSTAAATAIETFCSIFCAKFTKTLTSLAKNKRYIFTAYSEEEEKSKQLQTWVLNTLQ